MEIAIIGLGRMGANIARRLARGGHRVVVYNRSAAKALELAKEEPRIEAVTTLADIAKKLEPPRDAWLMVPAGEATETTLHGLFDRLSPGDTIIDGGNSNYKDTIRRAALVKERGWTSSTAAPAAGYGASPKATA